MFRTSGAVRVQGGGASSSPRPEAASACSAEDTAAWRNVAGMARGISLTRAQRHGGGARCGADGAAWRRRAESVGRTRQPAAACDVSLPQADPRCWQCNQAAARQLPLSPLLRRWVRLGNPSLCACCCAQAAVERVHVTSVHTQAQRTTRATTHTMNQSLCMYVSGRFSDSARLHASPKAARAARRNFPASR